MIFLQKLLNLTANKSLQALSLPENATQISARRAGSYQLIKHQIKPSFNQVMNTRRKYRNSNRRVQSTVPNQRQLSLTESVGGSWIQTKINQFQNFYSKVDETIDAVFTLLIPGIKIKCLTLLWPMIFKGILLSVPIGK